MAVIQLQHGLTSEIEGCEEDFRQNSEMGVTQFLLRHLQKPSYTEFKKHVSRARACAHSYMHAFLAMKHLTMAL